MEIIRVFPRRTKMTPADKLVFVGDPPLGVVEKLGKNRAVHISCTFTWDKPEAERLYRAWKTFYQYINIGGPAYNSAGGQFEPGMYVKKGSVITSRGCIRSCGFCLVPKREGSEIRLLPIRDGWNVLDNNLLACPDEHVYAVFDMLQRQPKPATFSGGLDARLLQSWHVELFHSIAIDQMFFASDTPSSIAFLERCANLLHNFKQNKKRCYVLVGFGDDTPELAEARLRTVWDLDFLPFAMLYRDETCRQRRLSREWSKLVKTWSRPAATKAHMAEAKPDAQTNMFIARPQ